MGEREIKVGQVWRNCIAEVEVTFRDVSYYYPKIRTTFSGGLTDEMDERVFRATHEWVSDPVVPPKVGSWFKEPTSGDYYVVSEAKGNELFRTCCAEAKILHFHDLKPCEPTPLVKALDKLELAVTGFVDSDYEAKALVSEWRAIKAKMGAK